MDFLFDNESDVNSLDEAIIVNKFKKKMTLFHGSDRDVEILTPSFKSAGNRIEKEKGRANFFFDNIESAKKYSLGKLSFYVFPYYLKRELKNIEALKDEKVKKERMAYINFLRNMVLGETMPPVCNKFGKSVELYAIDDRHINPDYPFCYNFLLFLYTLSSPVAYVFECNVDTKKIKHGHSSDFVEFTVFEEVPIDIRHKFTARDIISDCRINTFVTLENIKKFSGIIANRIKPEKDLFRRIITYKDWQKRRLEDVEIDNLLEDIISL